MASTSDCRHWNVDDSGLLHARDLPRQVYVAPCRDCDGSQYYVPERNGGYRVFDTREAAEEHLFDGYYEPVYSETVPNAVVREEWHPPSRLQFKMMAKRSRKTAATAKCFDGVVELNPAMFRNGNGIQDALKCILHELAHLHVGPRAHHNADFRERCEALGGSRWYEGRMETEEERQKRWEARRRRAIRRMRRP